MFLFSFTLFILLRFIFRCSVPFRSIPFRSDIENKIYYTFFFCSHFYLLWLAFSEEKSTQRYFFLLIVFIQISANRSRPRTNERIKLIRIGVNNFAVAVAVAAYSIVVAVFNLWKKSAVSWLIGFHLPSKCFFRCVFFFIFSLFVVCSVLLIWWFAMNATGDVCVCLYVHYTCILCFLFSFSFFLSFASLTDDASIRTTNSFLRAFYFPIRNLFGVCAVFGFIYAFYDT